jgi:PAP2 superfamily
MRKSQLTGTFMVAVALALSVRAAAAQSATTMDALKGLAPVSVLDSSPGGQAALTANLVRTGDIQHGTAHQPTLLPFAQQQQQALRDAFITGANASGLADGLGSTLGGAYQSLTGCTSNDDGNKDVHCPNISDNVAQLIAFASATTGGDATSGKYFFANETTDGKTPVGPDEKKILDDIKGATDIFGKAYGHPAGIPGGDLYGNSRPFETEPYIVAFTGKDFFGVESSSLGYLWGTSQPLFNSPSFPSGHTTYGYTESLLLALMLPERYPEMIARAAEYGNDRIVLGAHYTMDVLGGRTLALYDMAQLLANKQGYVGVERGGVTINNFQDALKAARADVVKALEAKCGGTIAACARRDDGRFADAARDRIFYESTQTYGLPAVNRPKVWQSEDVAKLAPEAGLLLTTAFPYLSLDRANAILTATEGPGGGFLDDGSRFGVYSRLDLYRAAVEAIEEGH